MKKAYSLIPLCIAPLLICSCGGNSPSSESSSSSPGTITVTNGSFKAKEAARQLFNAATINCDSIAPIENVSMENEQVDVEMAPDDISFAEYMDYAALKSVDTIDSTYCKVRFSEANAPFPFYANREADVLATYMVTDWDLRHDSSGYVLSVIVHSEGHFLSFCSGVSAETTDFGFGPLGFNMRQCSYLTPLCELEEIRLQTSIAFYSKIQAANGKLTYLGMQTERTTHEPLPWNSVEIIEGSEIHVGEGGSIDPTLFEADMTWAEIKEVYELQDYPGSYGLTISLPGGETTIPGLASDISLLVESEGGYAKCESSDIRPGWKVKVPWTSFTPDNLWLGMVNNLYFKQ